MTQKSSRDQTSKADRKNETGPGDQYVYKSSDPSLDHMAKMILSSPEILGLILKKCRPDIFVLPIPELAESLKKRRYNNSTGRSFRTPVGYDQSGKSSARSRKDDL